MKGRWRSNTGITGTPEGRKQVYGTENILQDII